MGSSMLVYQAKSFYNAYIALEQIDQMQNRSNLLYYIPKLVNGAFSIELSLKAILTENQIEYKKEHNLLILYLKLPVFFQNEIIGQLTKKAPAYSDPNKLTEELILISNAFVDWRYAFEGNSGPSLDARFLSAFANASIYSVLAHYNVDYVPSSDPIPPISEEELDKMISENRETFKNKNLDYISKRLENKKNQE